MKHVTSVLLAVMLIAFANCGSSPKASGADELDIAIREAADYLNTRIPAGNKTAFINISGGYPDLSEYILNNLAIYAVNDGVFSVVDRAQLDAVRTELNFNLSGEVDDSSAQEIGKMLGAQIIVSGSVRKIGASYRLDLRAIEVQTAAVQGAWGKNIPNGATISALTATTSSGATAAGGQASGQTAAGTRTSGGSAAGGTTQTATATPARPAAPKNGTYNFFPRPQATRAGMPIKAYVDQVVVRGNYLIITLAPEPRGNNTKDGPEGGNYWHAQDYIVLQDLDNPRLSWNCVETTYENPRRISFQGVTAKRFSLTNNFDGAPQIFEEIILGEPDE